MLTLNDDAPVAIGSQALTFTFFVYLHFKIFSMFLTATSSAVHFQDCGKNEETSSGTGNNRKLDYIFLVEQLK